MSMAGAGAGQDMARQSLANEMVSRRNEPRMPAPEIDRVPEPDERPDPHAQWDEVRGVWMVWNADTDSWDVLASDDATGEADGEGVRPDRS